MTYVSYEKVDGEFLPIMVHPSFKHIKSTYGSTYGSTVASFTSSMIIKTPFLPHTRVKNVFLKAFKSYEDEEMLDLLFGGGGQCIQAPKRG